MRKIMKYVIALLFIAYIGLFFLPVLDLAIFDVSLVDVIKLAFGNYASSQSDIWKELAPVFQEYLKPYFIWLVVWGMLLLLGLLSCFVLKRKLLYKFLIGLEVFINAYTVSICFLVIQKLNETKEVFQFLDIDFYVGIHLTTAIGWGAISIVIILLSFVGIWLEKKSLYVDNCNDVMPELYNSNENPWENYQDLTEYTPREPLPNQKDEYVMETVDESLIKDFQGAIIGTGQLYNGFVYPLTSKIEVFFHDYQDRMEVEEYENAHTIAGVYFIPEYQEYCIIPYGKMNVFLENGQPLGKQRYYYVPRGTKFYLNQTCFSFELG